MNDLGPGLLGGTEKSIGEYSIGDAGPRIGAGEEGRMAGAGRGAINPSDGSFRRIDRKENIDRKRVVRRPVWVSRG